MGVRSTRRSRDGGLDWCGERAIRSGWGARACLFFPFFLVIFPCAALAYCFGPPPSSATARSVSALMVAWLSRILSWGGGVGVIQQLGCGRRRRLHSQTLRIQCHESCCRFRMAVASPVVWCLDACVSGRSLSRVGACRCTAWYPVVGRSWRIAFVPYSRVGSQLL